MLYNKKYLISDSDVIDGSINWKITGSGAFVVGEYKGNKYFIKRNTNGPRPSKDLPKDIYMAQSKLADELELKQKEIAKLCKSLNVDTDHIVVEEDHFWDDDNTFVIVTRMIPDEEIDADYSFLSQAEFVKLCFDITALIKKIHDVGVTHGDLKNKNILIRRSGGERIPYLIDFDSSYPSNYGSRKNSDGTSLLGHPVVYSEGYQSPEITIYNFSEEGEIPSETITNKTDIFTLAIIFHRIWTNAFPAVVGENQAIGEAVYLDVPIAIDPKFDFELGADNKVKFSSLLRWMLVKDSATRPTADQVLEVLLDKAEVDEIYEGPSSSRFDLEPHSVHSAVLEILSKEDLKALNVKSFEKITDGGQYKYLVKLKDKTEARLTVDEVIEKGYGKAKETVVGEVWEGDWIEFLPVKELSRLGVASIEPKKVLMRKFYFVSLRVGGGYTTGAKGLVDRGLATITKKPTPGPIGGAGKPWPEHGLSLDLEALAERNFIKVDLVEEDGEKKYLLTKKVGEETIEMVVKYGYMNIMKFIK